MITLIEGVRMQFHLSFLLHGSAGRSITPTCSDADETLLVGDRVGGANDKMPSVSFALTVFNHPSEIISLSRSNLIIFIFIVILEFLYILGTLGKPCSGWEDLRSLQSATLVHKSPK